MENFAARIPMRDGAALAADVLLPAKPGRYPTILVQTPYDRSHFRSWFRAGGRPSSEVGRGAEQDFRALAQDREAYAFIIVDWRGFFGSRDALRTGPAARGRRGEDGFDAVEWIAAQPWSDGKVGTWGGSALGRQQLETAVEKPPHLVCCVPLIAPLGTDHSDFYEGGVLLEAHVMALDALGFGVSRFVRANPSEAAPLWRIVRRATWSPEAIEVPCLFITGWWDHFPDRIIETFEAVVREGGPAARAGSMLVVGPWDHVSVGLEAQGDLRFPAAAGASGEVARRFLAMHLRGIELPWATSPEPLQEPGDKMGLAPPANPEANPSYANRVRWFPAFGTTWRGAERWPGDGADEVIFTLRRDGTLAAGRPAATHPDGGVTFRSDPSEPVPTLGGANLPPVAHGPRRQERLDGRQGVDLVHFTSAPLEKPMAVRGRIRMDIRFTADVPTTDITARLCVVDADGKAHLLADAVRRVSGIVEGEVSVAGLRFPVLAAEIPAGARLRVYVAGTNWPRYERNTGTGAAHFDPKEAMLARVTIQEQGSVFVIPVE
jgi:predicted acyl esterase